LVADYLWEAKVTFAAGDKYKFDVAGDWKINFGGHQDGQLDGSAENDGADLSVTEPGVYVVLFNDATRQYQLQLVSSDVTGDVAAAAFADLITSKRAFYSLYSEQGNLGITEVKDANQFMPYVFDYSTNLLTVDEAHLGTGELVVNDDNSVSLMVANEQGDLEQDGTIRCTGVRDLNGSQIKEVLTQVTDPAQKAAMEAKFGTATFSLGAKAYLNTHSYSDGSSDVEVVLNEIAYENLLAIMSNPA